MISPKPNVDDEQKSENDLEFSEDVLMENSYNTIRKKTVPDIIIKFSRDFLGFLPSVSPARNNTAHTIFSYLDKSGNFIYSHIYLKSGRYVSCLELLASINDSISKSRLDLFIYFTEPSSRSKTFQLQVTENIIFCALHSDLIRLFSLDTLSQFKGKNRQSYNELKLESSNAIPFLASSEDTFVSDNESYYMVKNKSRLLSSLWKYKSALFAPRLIKIYLNEIEYCINGSRQSRLLAIVPGAPDNNQTIFDFQPVYTISRHLASTTISSYHIEVKDQDDNIIEFSTGSATYVNLLLKKKTIMEETEFISVDSSDLNSMNLYRTNTNTNFSIQLPENIFKRECKKWTLKVVSMSMGSNIFNITSPFNIITIIDGKPPFDQTLVTLEKGNYGSVNALVRMINISLAKNKLSGISFSLKKDYIVIGNSYSSEYRIFLHPMLSVILGASKVIENSAPYTIPGNNIFKMPFFANRQK